MKLKRKTIEKICSTYQHGQSVPTISRTFNAPLKTIYKVLKDSGIPIRSRTEQNHVRFINTPLTYAIKKPAGRQERDLYIAGLMLYWGEGAKTGNTVDLANSSPEAVQTFLSFLRKICQIKENKLRFYLYCFADQDTSSIINYWTKLLNVQQEQFTQPYVKKVTTTRPPRITPWGVLHVRYSDKKLLRELLVACGDVMNSLAVHFAGVDTEAVKRD